MWEKRRKQVIQPWRIFDRMGDAEILRKPTTAREGSQSSGASAESEARRWARDENERGFSVSDGESCQRIGDAR